MPDLPRAILIAGPTASGKSDLAIALAERFGGTIVNADSMQIYADLRVLTARPSSADEARVPHVLYGHMQACEAYSAGHYARDAANALAALKTQQRLPIIVGGTGLYFKVLLEGLSPVPEIDPPIRQKWRKAADVENAGALHAQLATLDPEMAARLAPGDRQRIVRALEVLEQTGRSLARWQETEGMPILASEDVAKFVVAPPRDVLHARAETRFEKMLDAGAVEEVRALLAQDLDPSLPALRALGVGPIGAWLRGEHDRKTALAQGKAETRQYIKRQSTWLKKNMMSWKQTSAQQTESQMADFLTFIDI